MTSAIDVLQKNKLLCTGSTFGGGVVPDLAPKIDTETEFRELVTQYYTFFRESAADDISFLRSARAHQAIGRFDSVIYNLRTAHQHADNPDAKAFYADWIKKYGVWQSMSDALATALIDALDELAKTSSFIRRDNAQAEAWKVRAAVQVETIFDAVSQDIHIKHRDNVRRALIANVKRRMKRLRKGSDVSASVKDLCAQEITAERTSLPVPYHQVLDRLCLIGSEHASAALLVAYSVGSSTSLEGEEFLSRVQSTWALASS